MINFDFLKYYIKILFILWLSFDASSDNFTWNVGASITLHSLWPLLVYSINILGLKPFCLPHPGPPKPGK